MHHLFLSYARKDNKPAAPGEIGFVSALCARLEQRHMVYSGRALSIFFEKRSIITGDYWESKIRQGLRSSRLFLAVLSPN